MLYIREVKKLNGYGRDDFSAKARLVTIVHGHKTIVIACRTYLFLYGSSSFYLKKKFQTEIEPFRRAVHDRLECYV